MRAVRLVQDGELCGCGCGALAVVRRRDEPSASSPRSIQSPRASVYGVDVSSFAPVVLLHPPTLARWQSLAAQAAGRGQLDDAFHAGSPCSLPVT